MNRILSLLLLLFCLSHRARAKDDTSRYILITAKVLDKESELKKNWLYMKGDDMAWAEPDLNDSNWTLASTPELQGMNGQNLDFESMGWFRLHFIIDSVGLTDDVIGIKLIQGGASEIFLDGKKIKEYGSINGKDSTKPFDPGNMPVALPPLSPGEHVLAIRYANYMVSRIREYDESPGFTLGVGYVNALSAENYYRGVYSTFGLVLLLGIFSALSFIHLFLFLYYRAARSNLYFSLFTASLAVFLLTGFVDIMSTSIEKQIAANIAMIVSLVVAAISISGFSNALFSGKKTRFYIITVISLVSLIIWFVSKDLGQVATLVVMVIVLLEITILNVRAIYFKIPGARIIGFGISFFAVFLLGCILMLALGELYFSVSGITALIFIVLAIFAIISIPASISIYLAWNFSRTSKDLAIQLKHVQSLSEKTLQQEQEKQRILETKQEELENEVAIRTAEVTRQKEEIEQQHSELKNEKKKSDDLLLNILPEEVAEELKEKGSSEAKYFDQVTVLFTDFVNFTKAGERMSPQQLVDELHTCFKAFDEICARYNIEKIKTIGDAYLAVCGLPLSDVDHATHTIQAAIEIQAFIANRRKEMPEHSFDIRLGIHSGSVVAGIVGVKKFAYDIWGDTVNTAARMEQNSEGGKINISEATYQLIKDKFQVTYRGKINAKNKGELNMYFVDREI